MTKGAPARILIIAGSDSGGGAGIQADIKTVTMLGGHAMTAVTAITAQNTLGVDAVHMVPTQMVIDQINAVVSDIGVDAVKIGMIGNAATAHAVADSLAELSCPIIFDPVMVATSGAVLADPDTISAFERLMGIATLTTPNLPELEALGGKDALLGRRIPLLIKGGHADGDDIIDTLHLAPGQHESWSDARINTHNTHGTGCTLASAIATGLGQGMEIVPAIERARLFVRLALRDAPGLGHGHGPMGHQSVREDAMVAGPSLNHVTMGCRDYAASVNFYMALGLQRIVDSPSNGYARFEAPNGVTFSIHQSDDVAASTIIYFESKRLDAWVTALASQGFAFEQLPQDESWGWREARLLDPAGNIVCLYKAGENRRYSAWRI
ncbi:bifunctional hydroxymethylpyrimidine kinase/phosphomethylpyrimidine kinase [Sphingorhabdus wooponensis]|jgi:hydroxymethylpyrimidine/phosphomethylpyrimidine kinase|uniref:hydroxymethylpyrimidine kinase n=1 Tax=Sphingorhabdus wooponensis TaxID=940136 RepID=A0A3R8RTH1_9SPHN|nr:bifunctional hydroxymethylpyrimidine kinase/phosphomethylpyrimidine kinase [Sphingorhabdus wooponensis]RRQ52292.1 bifunctional hydroxymethylpyrimidine kinase/phosphomethylpyrimidine kinase [Sphingorhabdus wooponensis]